MKITIDFSMAEVETLQSMYTELGDAAYLVHYSSNDFNEDEDKTEYIDDKLSVIEHICRSIEGLPCGRTRNHTKIGRSMP